MRKKIKDADCGGIGVMEEKNEERWARIDRWMKIPLDKEAVMKHFGYDPKTYIQMQVGWWPAEKVLFEMPILKSYQELTGNKKIRVVIDYDPDYPRAMFRVEQIPNPE